MSIPSGFTNSQEYFKKCLEFLQEYSWIYQTSNTCFIRDDVLTKFPKEWVEYFNTINPDELNAFPSRKQKTNLSKLDKFIKNLDKLIPNHIQINIPHIDYNLKKMSPKKQHEISKLSALIQNICADKIDILIDFGSGLGYLSELLYRLSAYKILGLESDADRMQTSIARQQAIYLNSKKSVFFKEHFVTNESKDFILTHVKEICPELKSPRLAIVGLHACADLTINSMKLFFTMENVQKLIIMPCCYHKLEMEAERFINFPLSKVLQGAVATKVSFDVFNRPFLRLACQQTSARWKKLTEKDHHAHSVDMFLRGVAEAILEDNEMVVKSNSKIITHQLSFSELSNVHELRSKSTKKQLVWTLEHEKRFSELVQKYPTGPKLAEGLTCLQTTMQELCENIVLYDRICYMEEQAEENNLNISVKFEKIMDELLSPRCFALIAQKL